MKKQKRPFRQLDGCQAGRSAYECNRSAPQIEDARGQQTKTFLVASSERTDDYDLLGPGYEEVSLDLNNL